jgi:hypothetical protein
MLSILQTPDFSIKILCGLPGGGTKAIPVTGRGGLQGCKMFRIPHCLDNRLTDGGKFVSPTHRTMMLYSPETLFFYASGTHFC